MSDVVLIGCTKTKRTERSAARDLYNPSDLFRRRRAYAEASGRPWAILHGPLHWAVASLRDCFRLTSRTAELGDDGYMHFVEPLSIELHAGVDYARTLALGVPAFHTRIMIEAPLAGLGIGEQKAWYNQPTLDLEVSA